jgi:hypothetical protein
MAAAGLGINAKLLQIRTLKSCIALHICNRCQGRSPFLENEACNPHVVFVTSQLKSVARFTAAIYFGHSQESILLSESRVSPFPLT